MKVEYKRHYSRNLNREMEFKVYGHAGKPVLVIPSQFARFYEFEDKRMIDVYAPYIEEGRIQVFAADSVDSETLAAFNGDPRGRIWWHEQWIKYLIEEAVPLFSEINTAANGEEFNFLVTGASLGGLHAATLFFRFPDVFDTLLCLSGIYTNEFFFGDYHDDLTYINSPQQFIKNMPADHPYLEKYRANKIILCVGQGAWENEALPSTLYFKDVLEEKNIPAWVDVWGYDVKHDWDWWQIQASYFLPKILD